jgi:pimeloyl-ACP methyl ester carboxylesterase
MDNEHDVARRTVLMSAGIGIGAGLVSGLAPAQAQGVTSAAAAGAEIWSSEYWASKGGVKLNLWRKRLGAPKAGDKPLPILFLVHGSSFSTRTSYDLHVPGNVDYSAMNLFARAGYDVWTMDHDGYGYSGSSGNNSDIASGVADLKAAAPVVMKETGQTKMHMYGPSSGSIRAGAYAMVEPERVDRLVLAAFTYKGKDSVEMDRRRKRIEELRANPRRKRDAAMIRSVYTRDGHAQGYDPALIEAIVAAEMKHGDTIPSGTYLDMAVNLPLVDPKKVKSPVLMLRGEHDGNSTNDDLLDFYRHCRTATACM